MNDYKKTVEFLDGDGKLAKVKAEITHRNGYAEFTASGDYLGCGGQCLDRIKPATEKQKELISIMKTLIDERNTQCNFKHLGIDGKINSMDKTVQNHEVRLNIIETKLNID
jgi:hypothetical protein